MLSLLVVMWVSTYSGADKKGNEHYIWVLQNVHTHTRSSNKNYLHSAGSHFQNYMKGNAYIVQKKLYEGKTHVLVGRKGKKYMALPWETVKQPKQCYDWIT